jgi:hypothetical protein
MWPTIITDVQVDGEKLAYKRVDGHTCVLFPRPQRNAQQLVLSFIVKIAVRKNVISFYFNTLYDWQKEFVNFFNVTVLQIKLWKTWNHEEFYLLKYNAM